MELLNLLNQLREGNIDERHTAANLLKLHGPPALEGLTRSVLHDIDGRVRTRAVESLGDIGDIAVPVLIDALKDRDFEVRHAAAACLGSIGSPDAIPALLESTKDPQKFVRSAADRALFEIFALISLEFPKLLEDPEPKVRLSAVRKLGKIGETRDARKTVTELLEKAQNNSDEAVRVAARKYLVRLNGDKKIEPGYSAQVKSIRWFGYQGSRKMGFFSSALDSIGLRSQRNELTSFVEKLRVMDGLELAFIVAGATHVRHKLEQDGHMVMEPTVYFQANPGFPLQLGAMIREHQARNEPHVAASLMVWLHTMRAGARLELRGLGRDMWRELGRGFPKVAEIPEYDLFTLLNEVPWIDDADQYPAGLTPEPQ